MLTHVHSTGKTVASPRDRNLRFVIDPPPQPAGGPVLIGVAIGEALEEILWRRAEAEARGVEGGGQ